MQLYNLHKENYYYFMNRVLNLLFSGLAVIVAAYIIPGVKIDNYFTAIVVAVFMGIVNFFLKPLLIILTLPINMLTLGLFTFVINALLIMLVDKIVPGFEIPGFLTALLFGLVLSFVNFFFNIIKARD